MIMTLADQFGNHVESTRRCHDVNRLGNGTDRFGHLGRIAGGLDARHRDDLAVGCAVSRKLKERI